MTTCTKLLEIVISDILFGFYSEVDTRPVRVV